MSSASPAIESAPPVLRKLIWQDATIAAIVPRTPTINSYILRPLRPFAFKAGQHVDVRLTAADGYQAQRSYSIANASGPGGDIELAIEKMHDGEVSLYFHDVAQVGDVVEIRGPIGGRFVWGAEDGGPVLHLGGGSGLVPLMSMIRERVATRSTVPMALLLSARSWDDVLWRDELMDLAARRDGFELLLTLTRETAGRDGHHLRRIDADMLREILARLPAAPALCYICGSNRFADAATNAAIAAGVPRMAMRIERYGN